jgi:hypothetical protein
MSIFKSFIISGLHGNSAWNIKQQSIMFNTLAYLLKARTVEPGKQLLLGNVHMQQ